jgi:hypothetical protein
MTSIIHLEAGRNHLDSPTDLNLGQKNGCDYYLLRRIIPSESIIQSHTLLHRNHNPETPQLDRHLGMRDDRFDR